MHDGAGAGNSTKRRAAMERRILVFGGRHIELGNLERGHSRGEDRSWREEVN
jgi:hypothetical protein